MKHSRQQAIRKGVATAAALALVVAAGLAQAAPVAQWTYSTDLTFSGAAYTSGTGLQTSLPYELSWGSSTGNFQAPVANADNNRSALTVGDPTAPGAPLIGGGPAEGTVNTTIGGTPDPSLGQIVDGLSLTHWNNPLSGLFSTLTGATATNTLFLTPVLPAGSPTEEVEPLIFQFKFQETSNAGAYGSGGFGNPGTGFCADGTAFNDPSHPAGCPDLFGFSDTLTLNNEFKYSDPDGEVADRTYFASLFVLDEDNQAFPLAQLDTLECQFLGLGTSCFGFSTEEAQTTTAKFALAITTEPFDIPEPGSIALLGLALAGLGFMRQRQLRRTI